MPVFYPDNVQTNSPSINPIVLGSSNHVSGFGFFDSIGSGNTNRNDIGSSFRAPGYLAVVYDSTSVADSEMYVYASTNITDGAWTTTSNWKSFEGAANTNLATNNLTQANEGRTYDTNGNALTFNNGGTNFFRLNGTGEFVAVMNGKVLRLNDDDNSDYVALTAPSAVSSSYTLTMPNAVAGADRLIQSNSTGTLSYAELSFASNTLVVGAQSVDISTAGSNTNLATDNLTQSTNPRTYSLQASNRLQFDSSDASASFQIQENSGSISALVSGDENSKLVVNGGAGTRLFGFTPNTSQSGNVVLKAPPGYTEGGIFYIDTDQLKFATPSYDTATEQLVIGTNSTDIGSVNTNLGTTDLTQSQSARTYTLESNDLLDFETSGTGKLRIQDSSGEMAVTVEGSESSYIGVFGGSANVFGFSPNTTQSGNIILKAPPIYTEGGIWYNESNQIKFATPSFDSATSTLVIGTNSTVISGAGSNLANTDLEQTSAEDREYLINSNNTELLFTTSDTNEASIKISQKTGTGELELTAGNYVNVKASNGNVGGGFKIYEGSNNGSDFVGFTVPTTLSESLSFIFPDASTPSTKALEIDSAGQIGYATLSISTDTLTLGAQNVVLPTGGGDNLSTANLTQSDADRTYDIGNGTLTFTESSDNIVKIDSTPAGTFADPYLVTFDGFQTIVPQTAGGGLLLDLDTDYITNNRFWGEVIELAPEQSTFSIGQIVTYDGSNGLTTAINSDATRCSLSMFMAVTGSATKKVMTRGYICLPTSAITGLSSANDAGKALYVDSTAGKMTLTTPSGGAFMRLVGHLIQVTQGTSNCVVYFNPEGTVFKTT